MFFAYCVICYFLSKMVVWFIFFLLSLRHENKENNYKPDGVAICCRSNVGTGEQRTGG